MNFCCFSFDARRVTYIQLALRHSWTLLSLFQSEYMNSKVYPMFMRYTILKDLIKDIMHHPDYMEVCHEVDNV